MKNRTAIIITIVLLTIITLPIVAAVVILGKKSDVEVANQAVTDTIQEDRSAEEVTEEPEKEKQPEAEDDTETEDLPQEDTAEEAVEEEAVELEPVRIPLPKYDPYLEINPYVSGWLEIDDSKIDSPVVYTPGSQNYFLHRALDGSDSERGTFFIAINWQEGFNNTLIYGHNMKDGSSFGGLSKFADRNYGMNHSKIRFDTLYDEKEYELFAVFYSQIDEEELETEEDRAEADRMIAEKSLEEKKETIAEEKKQEMAEDAGEEKTDSETETTDEGTQEETTEPEETLTEADLTIRDIDLHRDYGDEDIYRLEKDEDNGRFRYYYYNDLSDRADFDYFVDNVKQRALYDTGVDVSWGDELLTLSTCSYHVTNGRIVVVAVHHPE